MPGYNNITGDENDNTLNGTAAPDAIYGLGGNDRLDGGAVGRCHRAVRAGRGGAGWWVS